MGIALLPEHKDLAEVVSRIAAQYAPLASTRAEFEDLAAGMWPALWGRLEENGLLGLHLPEETGGDAAGLVLLAVVLEAAGQALVPGPLLPTLAAGVLVDRYARGEVRATVLTALAGGQVACAAPVADGLTARPGEDGGWLVSGETLPLPGALSAQWCVLGAQAEEGTVFFLVETGEVSRHAVRGVDLTRDFGLLRLHDLHVAPTHILEAGEPQVAAVLGVLAAAEAAGVARWCQEAGLAYVKQREQFGRAVGAFQAVQHKCAQLYSQVELMTAAAWDAASAGDGADETQFLLAARAAVETCVQGAVDLALDTVTLLGGIGYTWEHDVHLYWRRAIALASLLGPRAGNLAGLGALALTTARTVSFPVSHEPPGLRAEVAGILARVARESDPMRRRLLLAEERLVAPQFPPPYGRGANPLEQVVIAEEFARAGVEQPGLIVGEWAVPTVLAHGSDAQREEFVTPTLRGELVWCQLFSEPEAGSDLASLKTRAVRVPEGWRLTGQKVWTSQAHQADFGICLARTEPEAPKHRGIGYFLVDMHAKGVTVRPLREANGEYLFNEVFLDDVFVPDSRLVGGPTDGWRLARTTLGNERVRMASGMGGGGDLAALARLAREAPDHVDRDLGALTAEALALDALGRRELLRQLAGQPLGPGSSVQKVLSALHRARVTRTVVGWHGPEAAAWGKEGTADNVVHEYLSVPSQLIGGGTVEIQFNVIARAVLGLPRD